MTIADGAMAKSHLGLMQGSRKKAIERKRLGPGAVYPAPREIKIAQSMRQRLGVIMKWHLYHN